MNVAQRYDSPLRRERAAATRARILEACAAVMQTGADLTYARVAAEADVQERTVYRHFPSKSDLESGLWEWIIDTLTHADFDAASEEELLSSMRSSFEGFDAGAPLILAMLHSRQGLDVRIGRQRDRRAMFEACAASAVPTAPPTIRSDVAAALQVLYSAPAWELLRTFWGMDAARSSAVVAFAIQSLLAGVRARYEEGDAT